MDDDPIHSSSPDPRSRIDGSTARLTRCVDRTLTSYSAASCSGVNASVGPSTMCPALCTTTSTRPDARSTSATAARRVGVTPTAYRTAFRHRP